MKPTVCLDLDGTLAVYDHWRGIEHIGSPIEGAVEFTKQLAEFATIVIYTTRCKEYLGNAPAPPGAADPDRRPASELAEIVRSWLEKHGFAYDDIYTGQGKPFCHAIIDDRAVSCRPQDMRPDVAFGMALIRTKQLCQGFDVKSVSPALQQDLADGESSVQRP